MKEEKEPDLDILIGCDREMASINLDKAIHSAKDNDQMNNHIVILRWNAIHNLVNLSQEEFDKLRFSYCDHCSKHMESIDEIEFRYAGGEVKSVKGTGDPKNRVAPTIQIPMKAHCKRCKSGLKQKFVEIIVTVNP